MLSNFNELDKFHRVSVVQEDDRSKKTKVFEGVVFDENFKKVFHLTENFGRWKKVVFYRCLYVWYYCQARPVSCNNAFDLNALQLFLMLNANSQWKSPKAYLKNPYVECEHDIFHGATKSMIDQLLVLRKKLNFDQLPPEEDLYCIRIEAYKNDEYKILYEHYGFELTTTTRVDFTESNITTIICQSIDYKTSKNLFEKLSDKFSKMPLWARNTSVAGTVALLVCVIVGLTWYLLSKIFSIVLGPFGQANSPAAIFTTAKYFEQSPFSFQTQLIATLLIIGLFVVIAVTFVVKVYLFPHSTIDRSKSPRKSLSRSKRKSSIHQIN